MIKQHMSFDEATEYLAQKVSTMALPPAFVPKYDMVATLRKMRELFKNPAVRASVLNKNYEEARLARGLYSSGFCGIAAYIWSHLFRMPNGELIWEVHEYKENRRVAGPVHHVWLVNRFNGDILDLTFDQSVNQDGDLIPIPYHLGKVINVEKPFQRAYNFDKYLGMDLRDVVIRNKIKSEKLRGDETKPSFPPMRPDQSEYFESATQHLLQTIERMGLSKIDQINAKNLTLNFRDAFHSAQVKIETFYELTMPEIVDLGYDAAGFCAAASTTFASLMGGPAKGWQLMYIDKLWTFGPHFYVLHKPTNTIFDLTYDQFHGIEIPYYLGRPESLDTMLRDNRTKGFAHALGVDPVNFYKKQKD